MVDILGGMASGTPTSSFLAFKSNDLGFYVGEEKIDVDYLQLDPATFQSGWGKFDAARREFIFEWDEKFGVVGNKPADDYKRAFSCWLYANGVDRPLLWQRFSVAESMAFNKLLGQFWHDKDGKDGLPTFQFKGAKNIQVGMGKSAELDFDFVGFKPRKPEFVIPEWASNVDVGVQESESQGLTEDDIPF